MQHSNTRTWNLPKLPNQITEWLQQQYPQNGDFVFSSFYWYKGTTGEKIYGCLVHQNGKLYSNPQLSIKDAINN